MRGRTALRGTGLVGVGAVLVLLSLPLEWAEPGIKAPGGAAGLLLPGLCTKVDR